MWSWISLFIVLYRVCHVYTASKPHIIFILADDLGFNDVGFHGCNEIRTPNIDVLAYTGLILHNYYVTPICTPSRSAIMTGKYPIHNGMQHTVIYGAEPRGLPLEEKILPQYLKDLGYKTHLVGKWHLGSYKKEYLPLNRGFDSHLGFWTGKIDMYDHTNMEKGTWGYDFRRGFKIADDLFGQYATDVYTKEAVKLIKYHNKSEPMFLMVSHSAMHSGNPNEPLRAPDKLIANFSDIQDFQRRKYAAMLVNMDESVGKVVQALRTRGMLENSVIVFTTDNGGAAAGFNDNAASNYPLRGVKNTLWEGGVRGAGLLWSSKLAGRARVAAQKFHLVDWLPTLYRLAGGDVSVLKNLDGMDLWEHLYENLESNRTSVLHNIDNFDDVWNSAALTIGQWKIVAGTNYLGAWDGWYGPSCRNGSYKYEFLYKSDAAAAINTITRLPDKDQIKSIREAATIYCNKSIPVVPCKPLVTPCLYNIDADPCERENLADSFPTVVQAMLTELQSVNRTAVPPNNEPLDPIGDPKYWGRVFTNFGDYKVLPLKPT